MTGDDEAPPLPRVPGRSVWSLALPDETLVPPRYPATAVEFVWLLDGTSLTYAVVHRTTGRILATR